MAEGMHKLFPRNGEGDRPVAYECMVAQAPATVEDTAVARELYGTEHTHVGCRWSPRVEDDGSGGVLLRLPERGDLALVVISDAGIPWIVEWSPYG